MSYQDDYIWRSFIGFEDDSEDLKLNNHRLEMEMVFLICSFVVAAVRIFHDSDTLVIQGIIREVLAK